MKNEAQIKEKLRSYEAMLAGLQTGEAITNPKLFLTLSQHFPQETMALLRTTVEIDQFVKNLPPEDQGWCRRSFETLRLCCQQAVEERLSILRWVLEDY